MPSQGFARDRGESPLVHFYAASWADHLRILGPTDRIIASKIVRDTGPTTNLQFTEQELNQPFVR
jgi:hypothetical protein